MKTCEKCNKELELSEYEIDKRHQDGHKDVCIQCQQQVENKKINTIEDKITKYFKRNHIDLYKQIQIKAIIEDKSFVNALVDSIEVNDKYKIQ